MAENQERKLSKTIQTNLAVKEPTDGTPQLMKLEKPRREKSTTSRKPEPSRKHKREKSLKSPERKSPTKKTNKEPVQQTIDDHFTYVVRRSTRKTKSLIKSERVETLESKLLSKDESGLKSIDIEGKGKGVVATRPFARNELVCEYSGELISYEEAKEREKAYEEDPTIGCYMYYFKYKTKKLCVDATADNGRFGRLLNHSKTAANVSTKLIPVNDHPYLCLMAARDIQPGEELQYDYGERNKEAIKSHPWLTS